MKKTNFFIFVYVQKKICPSITSNFISNTFWIQYCLKKEQRFRLTNHRSDTEAEETRQQHVEAIRGRVPLDRHVLRHYDGLRDVHQRSQRAQHPREDQQRHVARELNKHWKKDDKSIKSWTFSTLILESFRISPYDLLQ